MHQMSLTHNKSLNKVSSDRRELNGKGREPTNKGQREYGSPEFRACKVWVVPPKVPTVSKYWESKVQRILGSIFV